MSEYKLVNGERVPLSASDILQREKDKANHEAIMKEKKKFKYREDRLKEYPPIGDQLDMLYKDKLNGTDLWFELIQTIKERYPKT